MKVDIDINDGSVYATRMQQERGWRGDDPEWHTVLNVLDPQGYNSDGTIHARMYREQIEKHIRWYGDGWPGGGDEIELIEFKPVDSIQVIECDRRPARKKTWWKRNGRQEV